MAGYTLTRNRCTARNKRNYVQFQLNLIFQRTFNVLLVKFSFGKLKMVEQHVSLRYALDVSEDYLVCDKIFGLVDESMASFRTEAIAKSLPKTV